MPADAGGTVPLIGSWCAPVGGWTTSNEWVFSSGGAFTYTVTGDIPTSESFNGGCHVMDVAPGTYTTSGNTVMIVRQPSTQTRTGCNNASDDGTDTNSLSAGTYTYTYSVNAGTLTLMMGAETLMLTSC